jgi:hypothetical protein
MLLSRPQTIHISCCRFTECCFYDVFCKEDDQARKNERIDEARQSIAPYKKIFNQNRIDGYGANNGDERHFQYPSFFLMI